MSRVCMPVGKWNVIYADCPWPMQGGPRNWKHNESSKPLPYPTLGVEEIIDMDVKSIAEDDAWLFLWVPNKYIEAGYEVARSWGFRPVTLLTWCKAPRGLGLGGDFVQTTEHILFAKRGHLKGTRRIESTWFAVTRTTKHSRKPAWFRDLITSLAPAKATKIELFARERVSDWDAWGNEV